MTYLNKYLLEENSSIYLIVRFLKLVSPIAKGGNKCWLQSLIHSGSVCPNLFWSAAQQLSEITQSSSAVAQRDDSCQGLDNVLFGELLREAFCFCQFKLTNAY